MNTTELTKLSDNILAKAFHLLHGDTWKSNWPEKSKADSMRSIIEGRESPCVSYQSYCDTISFLNKYISVETLSENEKLKEQVKELREALRRTVNVCNMYIANTIKHPDFKMTKDSTITHYFNEVTLLSNEALKNTNPSVS